MSHVHACTLCAVQLAFTHAVYTGASAIAECSPWRVGRGDALKGMSQVVAVAMVAGRTEVNVGTLGALPADPIERRGLATITHYTIMLHSCNKWRVKKLC